MTTNPNWYWLNEIQRRVDLARLEPNGVGTGIDRYCRGGVTNMGMLMNHAIDDVPKLVEAVREMADELERIFRVSNDDVAKEIAHQALKKYGL